MCAYAYARVCACVRERDGGREEKVKQTGESPGSRKHNSTPQGLFSNCFAKHKNSFGLGIHVLY